MQQFIRERLEVLRPLVNTRYGAGDGKIGEIVGKGSAEGKRLRSKFLESLPALRSLTDAVKAKAVATKTLKGLDGRILHVRSPHAALNVLLQSAGAILMKRALVELEILLQQEGLKNSYQRPVRPDYEYVSNVHDEYSLQVLEEHVDTVAPLTGEAMTLAGKYFNFRCLIEGVAKVGNTWKDVH